MKISYEVTGIQEVKQALSDFKDELPREMEVGLTAGLLPIVGAMKDEPPQPPYMGRPTTRPVHLYVRTHNYMQRISTPKITRDATGTMGTIESGDPASRWVRGTPDGSYLGAWMHKGIWTPLATILDKFLPGVVDRVQQRIDALIGRLGLGE